MKKLYFLFLLSAFSFTSFSQNSEQDCYEYYNKYFSERGGYKVEDGQHNNVIISIKTGSEAECFQGKVNVENGVITHIFFLLEDESFEEYKPKFKNDYPITVHNGVSRTQITIDDEIVNIFFIEKIKPKKQKRKKATLIKFD